MDLPRASSLCRRGAARRHARSLAASARLSVASVGCIALAVISATATLVVEVSSGRAVRSWDVVDDRLHDRRERGSDDDAHRHIDDVPLDRELAKLVQQVADPSPSGTLPGASTNGIAPACDASSRRWAASRDPS